MDILSEYESINKHLGISKNMHYLNMKGKFILNKLEKTKYIRKKRSGTCVFLEDVHAIHNTIVKITNIHRFNKLRLYFRMQYYLDELLYKEVMTLENFQIEDDEYSLPDIYFNQELWNPLNDDDDIAIYNFKSSDKYFDIDELIFLKFYFREYKDFLFDIKYYTEGVKNSTNVQKKLFRVFHRVFNKILDIDELLDKLILKNLKFGNILTST